MKLHDLISVMYASTKVVIYTLDELLKNEVADLLEDPVYTGLQDKQVKEVWYSPIYGAIVIEIE